LIIAERRTAIRQTVPTKASVEAETSTIINKRLFLIIDWLSMVWRLHQHNIGYTADGFYRSKDPTNRIKVQRENLQK